MAAGVLDLVDRYAIGQGTTFRFQLTLKATVVLTDEPVNVGRAVPRVWNPKKAKGGQPVFWGSDATVTTTTGTLLPPGDDLELDPAQDVWFVTSADALNKLVVVQVPIDLTGCTARMQIRSKVSSPDVLHSMTTEDGGLTLGGNQGTVRLYIPAATTETFTFKTGVYDLEIVSGDDVARVVAGSVAVSPEVTR